MYLVAALTRTRARIVLLGIVFLNALFWTYLNTLDHERLIQTLYSWAYVPSAEVSLVRALVQLTASTFMHLRGDHLFYNMVLLALYGWRATATLTPATFAGIYLSGGLLGYAVQSTWTSGAAIPLIGASPAVAAIMGCRIMLAAQHWRQLNGTDIGLGFFSAILLAQSYSRLGTDTSAGGVAYASHLAGFASGALFILAAHLSNRLREPGLKKMRRSIAAPPGKRKNHMSNISTTAKNALILMAVLGTAIVIGCIMEGIPVKALSGLILVLLLVAIDELVTTPLGILVLIHTALGGAAAGALIGKYTRKPVVRSAVYGAVIGTALAIAYGSAMVLLV